ncbi:hypothetical protein [Bacillus sp. JCM 19041]|uniref:hypothetical protein n=1 Tax=Bacillus sp. JCM 19041 TaxID=1460637 RepID=UPI0012E1CF73
MMRKLLIIIALIFGVGQLFTNAAYAIAPVEVFDLQKEKVTESVPSSATIEKEAKKLIKSVDSLVTKIDPIPKTGYMIKVPFSSPTPVHNQWVETELDQAIFIFPVDEKPYVMLVNEQEQAIFLYFSADSQSLFNALKFDPFN